MTRFTLSVAAMTAALAAPAFAADSNWAELIRSRDITDAPVYSMGSMGDSDTMQSEWTAGYDSVENEWNEIGEIEDLVLDAKGQLIGFVAEVGGFLDVGDKHVMINVDDVRLVPVDDRSYAFVTRRTEEQLEEMDSVDESWWN